MTTLPTPKPPLASPPPKTDYTIMQLIKLNETLEKIEKRTRTLHIIVVSALIVIFAVPLAALIVFGFLLILAALGYAIGPSR